MTFPSILGHGLAYPMRLDSTGARPAIASEEERVKQSIDQIVNTHITERPFLTRNGVPFGTRIRECLFSSAEIASDIIQHEVKRALDLWEPRIIVVTVDCSEVPQTSGSSVVMTVIGYRYRATSRSDNFIVPFRLQRAAT